MNNNRTKVKEIILDDFNNLLSILEEDFKKNYKRKKHNFLLNQMDDTLIANMVFVSSFESKSGNAIESSAEKIARLTYGKKNVPNILNPFNLDTTELNIKENPIGQTLITNVDLNDGNLCGAISSFRSNNVASGRGKKRVESNVTNQSIQTELHPLTYQYKKDIIIQKPIDLVFFDGDHWNIMELKAGGDLDSSNAPANIEKLLSIYVGLGTKEAKVYFATLYNKDGEGNNWTGAVKKHISYPNNFLIGKELWDKILPDNIDYDEFIEIYKESLQEIDLNDKVQYLIANTR